MDNKVLGIVFGAGIISLAGGSFLDISGITAIGIFLTTGSAVYYMIQKNDNSSAIED